MLRRAYISSFTSWTCASMHRYQIQRKSRVAGDSMQSHIFSIASRGANQDARPRKAETFCGSSPGLHASPIFFRGQNVLRVCCVTTTPELEVSELVLILRSSYSYRRDFYFPRWKCARVDMSKMMVFVNFKEERACTGRIMRKMRERGWGFIGKCTFRDFVIYAN